MCVCALGRDGAGFRGVACVFTKGGGGAGCVCEIGGLRGVVCSGTCACLYACVGVEAGVRGCQNVYVHASAHARMRACKCTQTWLRHQPAHIPIAFAESNYDLVCECERACECMCVYMCE